LERQAQLLVPSPLAFCTMDSAYDGCGWRLALTEHLTQVHEKMSRAFLAAASKEAFLHTTNTQLQDQRGRIPADHGALGTDSAISSLVADWEATIIFMQKLTSCKLSDDLVKMCFE